MHILASIAGVQNGLRTVLDTNGTFILGGVLSVSVFVVRLPFEAIADGVPALVGQLPATLSGVLEGFVS